MAFSALRKRRQFTETDLVRVNIRELILPEANRGDFEEIPEHIREGITVHFADKFDDVVPVVFNK